ncbi:hypothetical protein Psch_01402 [Pelotomaculum schinkii]|uniref:DUF1657 domain-containing protein n=1 Tax=Pelotomaculum schinkii TaxID=78350 RepID=A0A4Y7RHQ9_9FIRM|nr:MULTISPECIES: DUF1657 domain-containing protein [Pelotomaculum]TEB07847.1 hypothetical protein Psch_01402 [Pelotomaculum schinkii]TEB16701.1 hypothetical protein Psfp_01102 [Pelotomaculum sp. FP]
MTISAQVKQTLASLKGIEATLEDFSRIEENTEAKEVLRRNAQRVNQVIGNFEKRLSVLEFEEPQYKGF